MPEAERPSAQPAAVIGGEHIYDPAWLLPERVHLPGLFLAGGRACLRLIAQSLRAQGIRRILIPEYICSAVPSALRREGLACSPYPLDDHLQPQLEDLHQRALRTGALLFVNWYGFPPSAPFAGLLHSLRTAGVWTVEDNAQGGIPHPELAAFSFNSLRKFCPYDGAWLTSPFPLPELREPREAPTSPSPRLQLIRAYRTRLTEYQLCGTGSRRDLQRLYLQAERAYNASLDLAGDPQERAGIERTNWPLIRRRRQENYAALLALLAHIPQLTPRLPSPAAAALAEAMPLGFPVRVPAHLRETLLRGLAQEGFGAQSHWPGPQLTSHARQITSESLVLPLPPSAQPRDLEHLARLLSGLCASAG